MILYFLIGFSM